VFVPCVIAVAVATLGFWLGAGLPAASAWSAVADQLKPHAAAAVARIRRLGIRPLLVTGDNEHAARSVADELGIAAADVWPGSSLTARSRPSGTCRRTGPRSPWPATG
jgi:P-type E1-E2 ATPase